MIKKSLIIIFLSLLAIKISYSQHVGITYSMPAYSDCSLKDKNLKNGIFNEITLKKKTKVSGLRFSLGGGIATPLGSGDISALITANANFRIYESVFLTAGYEVFELFVTNSKYANVLYIAPNLNANFFKNMFSFFGGIGFYVITPKKEGLMPSGVVFLARVENNLSKTFSIGMEIKHVKFIGERLSNYPFYLFNLYFSIKL